MKKTVLGRLVGNTGDANNLTMVLASSFAARRGEFVRIAHQEREDEPKADVLGRIVSLTRINSLYNAGLGSAAASLDLMPGAQVTGETIAAKIELIGYRDPITDEVRIPRRPLDPGSRVLPVDYQFLSSFYRFDEQTSIHIGNLVGYERGEDTVPVFLEVNKLVTEHVAILAMTGSGKSYTVGRIIERLVALHNGTVVVFDPHGEYGRALQGGKLQFNPNLGEVGDHRDQLAIPVIQDTLQRLQAAGAGIAVYTPQNPSFRLKYAGKNNELALQFDHFEMDDIAEILPGLTEPQQRVLDVAMRYWRTDKAEPRDINRLRNLLGEGIDELKQWDQLSKAESDALNNRSAAITSMKLSRVLNEAQSFYSAALATPTNIYDLIGRPADRRGRLAIIDLQGLSDTAKQIITALISSEILGAASSKTDPSRPTFVVFEEGHNFAPAGESAVSLRIIKKIAAEGRKFGVGFAIVSQRPSKLDPDVTSQCNTLITMRLKNPDDQRFIAKTSDMISSADLDELPSLSTGEALIVGRSITAPLLVKIGPKALLHGGESPEVLKVWGGLVLDGLTARLNAELLPLRQTRESFPLWTSRGLPDGTIHSAGISMLTALGQALGYEAYCEMPAPRKGRYAYVGDDVRSDSAWLDRNTGSPVLLAEFERYSGQIDESGLLIKVKNLLLAHHRAGEMAECLVLAYWTKSLRDLPDHDALAHVFRRGFQTRAMEPVDGSSSGGLLIYQFILREADSGCWRLDQVKERGVR